MVDYYTKTGAPVTDGPGSSADMRAELALVETGFGKIAPYTGNGGKTVRINDAGTGQGVSKVTITEPATAATLTLADGSILATAGAYSVTFTFTGATGITFPTSGTLVNTTLLAATAFNAALPAQAGNAGKFVTSDGTNASWADIKPQWQTKTTNFTAVAGGYYDVDTSGGVVTATPPATMAADDFFVINDLKGTFATNNCVIAQGGHKIDSLAEDFRCDLNNEERTVTYKNVTIGVTVR